MIDLDFTARFIAGFEGFVDHVYLDAVGVETIGYGETSRSVIERCRQSGISQEDALELLKARVQEFADAVEGCVSNPEALTPTRHAALTSFAYNVGVGGFAESTACARFNAGDFPGVVEAMSWWNKGGGRVLEGLSRRRAAEGELFLSDDASGVSSLASPAMSADAAVSAYLRLGDRNEKVRQCQQSLSACGWTLLPDGYFGPVTAEVVRSFQRSCGLQDDGIVGPDTWQALSSSAPAATPPAGGSEAPPPPGRVLRQGDDGDDVRQAQQRLSERGWALAVDSRFGPKTDGIVRAFQGEKGLDVDGQIGPMTWQSLWTAPITGGATNPDAA